jgi:hypothetical protein
MMSGMIENTTPEITESPQRSAFKFKYINKSACKRLTLDMAKTLRPANKFTRVSEEFLISCEAALKNHIQSRVKTHPSKGKTLM